jgi:hypothetical protein
MNMVTTAFDPNMYYSITRYTDVDGQACEVKMHGGTEKEASDWGFKMIPVGASLDFQETYAYSVVS